MTLENYSVVTILWVVSFLMLITGYWFKVKPPKKINMIYGYRTKNSMRSQSRWDFAHSYSGKLYLQLGLILFLLGFISMFFKYDPEIGMFIGISLAIIGNVIIIYKTERSLKEKFKN